MVKTITNQFSNAKIVFCLSVSVYKEGEKTILENSELGPTTPYEKSKLKGEQIIVKHKKYSIVRISSIYGSNMKGNTFLPLIIQSALNNFKITLYGSGNRLQNYIHVDDVAQYLFAAGQTNKNDVFLATAKSSVSNKQVAEFIKRVISSTEIIYKGIDN